MSPARSGSCFLGGGPWAPKHGRIRTERASLAQVSPGPRRARGHWALPRGTRESALAQSWAFDEAFHGGTGRPAVPAPAPRPPALSASTLSHQALGEVGPALLGRRAACHAPFVLTSTFPHLLARGTLHSTPALGLCYIFLFVYEFCISKPTALPAHAAAGGP